MESDAVAESQHNECVARNKGLVDSQLAAPPFSPDKVSLYLASGERLKFSPGDVSQVVGLPGRLDRVTLVCQNGATYRIPVSEEDFCRLVPEWVDKETGVL